MVGTFRNFFIQYTEDHMRELTNRLDYDLNDYHELVFRIYPEEKKIDVKSYCYYLQYTQHEYQEKTPEHIAEMMDEDNVSWFKVEFWQHDAGGAGIQPFSIADQPRIPRITLAGSTPVSL